MTHETELKMNTSALYKVLSLLFAAVALLIGIVNMFWGNDPGFGIFIAMLSLLFIPRINALIKAKTGRSIPGILKILLALFILWAALGVGELFDKIDLMMKDLQ